MARKEEGCGGCEVKISREERHGGRWNCENGVVYVVLFFFFFKQKTAYEIGQ